MSGNLAPQKGIKTVFIPQVTLLLGMCMISLRQPLLQLSTECFDATSSSQQSTWINACLTANDDISYAFPVILCIIRVSS